ncbi:BLUF domain-containing protein [Ohtaekwangia koreensis]|uniref:Sensors of blue-light using FAD n=1 Tax=Ohtaekwangia koreensis TaxID=688867 RepID=A0A1T5KJN0_9BACT|nr:BLUF domain-containing protein [Ohtaekwangia koreensis]SKC63942.1 Sensors of blue-light using FAD [Ohtaekwangia koreensis]
MLAHLVYVSVRKRNCTDEEMDKILAACKVNNEPLQVTGVLLYSDSTFIQYVEGKATTLTDLYDKIKKDARHEKPVMISYGPITKRIFPSWQMGSRKMASDNIDFVTDITHQDKDVFQRIMNGKETEGAKVRDLLTKFFKK